LSLNYLIISRQSQNPEIIEFAREVHEISALITKKIQHPITQTKIVNSEMQDKNSPAHGLCSNLFEPSKNVFYESTGVL
jgi:hypothetical protein